MNVKVCEEFHTKIQLKYFYDFSIINSDLRSISVSATCHIFLLILFILMINSKTKKKSDDDMAEEGTTSNVAFVHHSPIDGCRKPVNLKSINV